MQIFVQSYAGESLPVEVSATSTVLELKQHLEARLGVAASVQRLFFGVSAIDDAVTLGEAGVEEESTLFQSLELLGAGKKRKRKTYTKPKKQKHKNKKVKLAVLKFYKVDDNNNVTRLRKECPSKTCGSGVFMAQHENRNYCGRCGITYILQGGGDH
ncbi:ubiquitin / ribosomal protein S27a fusion protein, putative [Eimeria acervulina]|uniref:Ubiquitin / ribosomal protein S27a fusion protein, putative n=1 Tax=Eimeria acervulina TaxID=5801 RepID=U6GHW4_EIMAC|nr:ubiquitin / ribosomal protein S27a fusion protein, putative [Eimeria acervulina]CDI79760.1 ubiquitin / ribosomal protein S27a fusion protein, putative [Eimeria acervulina]